MQLQRQRQALSGTRSALHHAVWAPSCTRARRARVVTEATPAAAAAAAAAPPMHVDVAIAGAGPAGLAAAAALKKADPTLKVHVFERTAMSHRGAAVLVGVNGLLALEAIDPSLVQGLLDKAITLEGSDRYNMHTGEWLEYMPMSNDKFKERYGYSNALLGWSDITAALAAALPPGAITTSCPITAYAQQADGTIQLLAPSAAEPAAAAAADGSGSRPAAAAAAGAPSDSAASEEQQQQQQQQQRVVATCRVLVGADGWFSAIRQQLLADGAPEFRDMVVFRARVPRPAGLPERRTKWWVPPTGPNNADSLAVLIPVPGGDLVWQCHAPLSVLQDKGLAFDPAAGEAASSHADNTRGSGSGAGSDGGGRGSSGRAAGVKARCLKAFEAFPAAFTDVVAATPEEAITEHGLYQRTPEQIPDGAWGSGMVTLVGDAAHCAYVDGTGLALSLEDAAVLGAHVQQQGLTEAALRAFERERIPRVKAIFGLAAAQAAKIRAGVPQRELLDERAELLYGQASFRPLQRAAGSGGGGEAAGAGAGGAAVSAQLAA